MLATSHLGSLSVYAGGTCWNKLYSLGVKISLLAALLADHSTRGEFSALHVLSPDFNSHY